MSANLKRLRAIFTKLPENLSAQYSESNYYSLSAGQAEKKLKSAHERTNAALVERNQALIRLNEQLSEAVDYVKTMLPRPIKAGPVQIDWEFIPSNSLGGDAFGYHWLDDDNFAIYYSSDCKSQSAAIRIH